jgi:hypothetical protein
MCIDVTDQCLVLCSSGNPYQQSRYYYDEQQAAAEGQQQQQQQSQQQPLPYANPLDPDAYRTPTKLDLLLQRVRTQIKRVPPSLVLRTVRLSFCFSFYALLHCSCILMQCALHLALLTLQAVRGMIPAGAVLGYIVTPR